MLFPESVERENSWSWAEVRRWVGIGGGKGGKGLRREGREKMISENGDINYSGKESIFKGQILKIQAKVMQAPSTLERKEQTVRSNT